MKNPNIKGIGIRVSKKAYDEIARAVEISSEEIPTSLSRFITQAALEKARILIKERPRDSG